MARWPPGVITRFVGSLHGARRTADVVTKASDAGLPVPRHHLVVDLDGDVLMLQDRLPGAARNKITPVVIDTIVAVNDRFANLLEDRPDVPILPLCLDISGDPHPRHETLLAYGTRSRRVLGAIKAVGARGPRTMIGADLVHVDLTTPNILFDDNGGISGVVDWNLGAYRGDRHLALVKTRFELEWGLSSPAPERSEIAAAAHLDEILRQRVPPDVLRAYWAHRVLYQLHFALQFASPDVIDWHLRVAEERLLGSSRQPSEVGARRHTPPSPQP
ncbi:phosphotransferase [Microlunatus sp. Gsoil 973]|uniref:phosphotransferase n=1 Tax=Microlunatus sp. Gsoil 973 TaxID=2672569 RepID=UPI0012B453FA|nr:phosphotransferase [Microlunatus sp. Gsoil 973]QGN32652.1 phosphotransferase [Microlunatus sp. Gsoil 973]